MEGPGVPSLSDLIKLVRNNAEEKTALGFLKAATVVSEQLGGLSDDLINHFVQEARAEGGSWSQIGEMLQVSKQAAQQRFKPFTREHAIVGSRPRGGMFDRFTDRARRVLVLAQDEARNMNHNYIGTEHLLLGLIVEEQGIAARALGTLGVSLGDVRREVTEIIAHGTSPVTGTPPFTPRARKILELSLKEALQLGHNYIGTEHILLGLISEGEGVGALVLLKFGVGYEETREVILKLLSGYSA